jgi:hypothetical protein
MLHTCKIKEYLSTISEVLHGILIQVKYIMVGAEVETEEEFWLFHDLEKKEIVEHRKFIDLELNPSFLENIDKLIDGLCLL